MRSPRQHIARGSGSPAYVVTITAYDLVSAVKVVASSPEEAKRVAFERNENISVDVREVDGDSDEPTAK